MLSISSLILTIVVSDISCYTLLAPKLYSQSLPSNNRPWSNVVPYPFRSYQPSIPIQYYGRYVGDPYFTNMQNPDYYFSQDNYPYSSSFDDPDYYSNVLYYIPANRRIPYYEQPVIDPMDDIQDYDEDSEEGIPKSQRDWWLEKNVLPNEEKDLSDFNLMDDLHLMKEPLAPKKSKSKIDSKKKPNKSRYTGIDGFGRKKDKEQVFGTYRPNPRRDEERTWVYGVPRRSDYEDPDVRDLRSLLKEPKPETKVQDYGNSDIANWIVGNAKRSVDSKSNVKENSSVAKVVSTLKPVTNTFPIYNEAGRENIPIDYAESDDWSDDINQPQEPSVFDKIKKLLALEDEMNQQINKRNKACTKCKVQNTTIKIFPEVTTKAPEGNKNHKRSAAKIDKKIVSDEETLVRQLSALKHIRS